MFRPQAIIAAVLVTAFTLGRASPARNVDLSTVPRRDSVELTIYNSEDLTLVRETRAITFKRGVNPLEFSWANTLIDPTSVELRFLNAAEKLEVLDTTYPHDRPQVLYWSVQSEFDGEAMVEISYFTSGITWSADYQAVADRDEKLLKLEGFVRVTNNSGEDYEDAHVRLVVGTINLVEKIAELARIPLQEVEKLAASAKRELREDAARSLAGAAAPVPASAPEMSKEKEIIKEGLSEYFIYSIDGAETIPSGWSKRMRSFDGTSVPIKVRYRYRPQEYGDQLVRMYVLTNDKASKLGTTPLPDGTIRVFRDNGRDGLSYLAAQSIKYVAIGDKIELNLGRDPNVIFELIKLRTYRDNIWLKLAGAEVFERADRPGVRIEPSAIVAGWTDHEIYSQRIRNYTGAPIDLEIRRAFPGDVTFRSRLQPTLHDYQTVQFTASVDPGKTSDNLFEVVSRQGHDARQQNVKLEDAAAQP